LIKKILRNLYKKNEVFLSGRGLNRYYIIKTGAKFLKSRLKSDFVIIDNHKMFLDQHDSLRLSINGVYEEFETSIIKKLIKKGDYVVDVGANIGYYTLIFARIVGTEGKVFAFEPEPTNFELLKKNIKINGYKNVECIQKSVSNRNEKTRLYIDDDNMGGHTMINDTKNKNFIEIESVQLDDYFKDLERKINFIKIDVEGFEIKVIDGMRTLLQNNNEIKMMVEFNPYLIKKFGSDNKKFFNLLEKFQFDISNIEKNNHTVSHIDLNELPKKFDPEKQNNTNLLCVKGVEKFI